MPMQVALLRGVNVGGGNKVPMAMLRDVAEACGWARVKTYIASGNLVFDATDPPNVTAPALRAALADAVGVDVPILCLSGTDMQAIAESCPFPEAAGNHAHAFFCWADPIIDEAMLLAHRTDTERLRHRGRVVWLHAPDGIGRSRLADRIGKVITGTDVTARNLNTVRKLADMTRG